MEGLIEANKTKNERNYISKSSLQLCHHCEVGDRNVNLCTFAVSHSDAPVSPSPRKVLAPFAIDCISPRLTWLWSKRLHGHHHQHLVRRLFRLDLLECTAPIVSNETKVVGFQRLKPKNWKNSSHLGVRHMKIHDISIPLHFWVWHFRVWIAEALLSKNLCKTIHKLHKSHKFKTCKNISKAFPHPRYQSAWPLAIDWLQLQLVLPRKLLCWFREGLNGILVIFALKETNSKTKKTAAVALICWRFLSKRARTCCQSQAAALQRGRNTCLRSWQL